MTRSIDPTRACWPVDKWPPADQALWKQALSPDSYESGIGNHANWRPTSTRTNREGYGRWINFLARHGIDMALSPADRVTNANVREYLAELKAQGLAPQTRSNRVSQLLSVMFLFAPGGDWDWLRHKFNRLEVVAKDERDPKPLSVLAGDVLGPALKYLGAQSGMERIQGIDTAIEYRNWLMIAMLTFVPLRRDNFANLSMQRHFFWRNGEWVIELRAAQAKNKRPIAHPVPGALNEFIRFYLESVRPMLLAGEKTDRLWISRKHNPMSSHSVFICITNFTRKMFGTEINPHRFRHISATSVVIANPAQTEAARALLGHSDKRMTEDRYIIAQSLAASREHAVMIAQMRQKL
jgi:site-specific recombinase XerD